MHSLLTGGVGSTRTPPDGSQEISAYDKAWMEHYGGCDGVVADDTCTTEPRQADNDYFPSAMTPLENPFYLDLPFSDLEDDTAFAERGRVVSWGTTRAMRGGRTTGRSAT